MITRCHFFGDCQQNHIHHGVCRQCPNTPAYEIVSIVEKKPYSEVEGVCEAHAKRVSGWDLVRLHDESVIDI